MTRKTQWHLMTWREIAKARDAGSVVLVPAGTVETQGIHTAIGYEHIVPQRLAAAVAERTNAIVTPVLPFGFSPDYVTYPGTISLRPETLGAYYEDVLRSIASHGFTHILVLVGHNPNAPYLYAAGYKLLAEMGVRIAWVNPLNVADKLLKEVSPNYAEAKGHGADPGISLGEYLEPGSTDFTDLEPNRPAKEFVGFPLSAKTPQYGGFPLSMAVMLDEISPGLTGSAGDPSYGSAEQGERLFALLVEHTVELVERFGKADLQVKA